MMVLPGQAPTFFFFFSENQIYFFLYCCSFPALLNLAVFIPMPLQNSQLLLLLLDQAFWA